jgi:hypothetical protein
MDVLQVCYEVCVNWIGMSNDINQQWALVKSVMDFILSILFFRPDRPWGPPSLLYNTYRVFPEGKERPGREADSPSSSSAVVLNG